jgi:small subunit ribosomal protein S16
MALTIRLRQQGRNNRPFYRIVLADSRSPRDGKYIEMLGWYNPFETEMDKLVHLDAAKVDQWVKKGAQLSENVRTLVKKLAPEVINGETARVLAKKNRARLQRKNRGKEAKKAVKSKK